MSVIFDGFAASEGIAEGPAHLVRWKEPKIPHRMIERDRVAEEIERFHEAREWAKRRIGEFRESTEGRLGPVEARIFDPHLLILDDEELVDGTVRYIQRNLLTAEQAFEWRMLEIQAMWTRTSHPMVLDRVNDLEDIRIRILSRLVGEGDPADLARIERPVIIVAQDLAPSFTVQLDRDLVLGIATDRGTRTSHWAILSRSLSIPTVVGLGDFSTKVKERSEVILDGRIGRVILEPEESERTAFRNRGVRIREWEEEIAVIAGMDAVTAEGHPVLLRGNLDLPEEVDQAVKFGAEGIGLFRTEFLVVGRSSMPGEEEQYEAYRQVAEAVPSGAVVIRTFDLGGDKFPLFLPLPREDNPFLGWRGIRLCLDEPDLFRTQLRAILRATVHGDIRIMIPMVNDGGEIRRVRALLEEEEEGLRRRGIPFEPGYELGILVETPAAALDAVELARHSDFFSIGTNDLVQYTLAVDRTNTRLAGLYNPFHPAVVRQLHRLSRVSRAAGIELSVCGELAAHPLGAFLLLGLGIDVLSVAWPSIPEIKSVIRQFRLEEARVAAKRALAARTSEAVTNRLAEGIGNSVDLTAFSGRWNLSPRP